MKNSTMRSLNSSAHQSLSVGAARRSPLAARHSTSVPTTLEQGGAAALGRSVCFLSSGDRSRRRRRRLSHTDRPAAISSSIVIFYDLQKKSSTAGSGERGGALIRNYKRVVSLQSFSR